jgi:thioredoxin reductase (NADPH)
LKEIATDLLIIGGGPAGLGAAIYAARSALDFRIVEKFIAGGQIITTEYIENYPGFKEDISGFDLMQNIIEHCKKFNVKVEEYFSVGSIEIKKDKIKGISDNKYYRFLCNGESAVIGAKSLIIATGTSPRRLFVEGESKFIGKGISYCATCDGALYRDREVMVIGGGNTAVQEALFLTKFANVVYIIHRRDELRAVKLLQKRAFENPKIEFIWNSVIEKFSGKERLDEILIKDLKTGKKYNKKIDGVFEYIGIKPNSELVKDIVKLDNNGFIITNSQMETSMPGLFAAGDVRNTPLRQVLTAMADGAIAATYADRYLNSLI